MSTPGPTLIIECATCLNYMAKHSLNSSFVLFTVGYSDGYTYSIGDEEFPVLSKCEKCSTYFWVHEARKIAIYNLSHYEEDKIYDDLSVKSKEAKALKFIGFDDYIKVLNTPVIKNDEDELFVRSRILWGFNDRIRKDIFGGKLKQSLFQNENDESIWNFNLSRLYELLDTKSDDAIIMKADVCRTMGKFDECIALINMITEEKNYWMKKYFILACEKGNKEVFNLSALYLKEKSNDTNTEII